MGLMELIITVCAVAQPAHCEEAHLQWAGTGSPGECAMAAPPYIARWIDDHPKWRAVRWRCDASRKRDI